MKDQPIQETFKKFLKKHKAYNHFVYDTEKNYGDVDKYLYDDHMSTHPGYFVKDFTMWVKSSVNAKNPWEYWDKIHQEWIKYLRENNIEDKAELYNP